MKIKKKGKDHKKYNEELNTPCIYITYQVFYIRSEQWLGEINKKE